MLYDKKQVMQFLPHRDPFLFIDGVKEVIPAESMKGRQGPFKSSEIVGAKSICVFKVDQSVKVLEGHFPGFPILPGVVQIEMMAQAASFLTVFCIEKPIEQTKLDVQLLGVESAKFRKPVLPPMELEIHATLIKVRGTIQIYDCEIHSNGELISQTTVMASLKISYHEARN
jgi:3-hydroxyacyl-[acyl-carrier-protein] dehydratase